jgi:hypothetical protein
MSNIEQTHFLPHWRQLCQSARLERDPVKLLERVARARSAILDRIEDGHTKPLNGEQHDLRDALTALDSLRRITERQNGYQSKASSSLPRDQSADQLQLARIISSRPARNGLDEDAGAHSDGGI